MITKILEELVGKYAIKEFIVDDDISHAKSEIEKLIEGIVPNKKEVIDVTKKMCHNLEYPTPCLYDEPDPNGATCLMQDRKISKEQCKDYRDMQVEYEDFAQYNQAIADFKRGIANL